jgi:hypothetical protein
MRRYRDIAISFFELTRQLHQVLRESSMFRYRTNEFQVLVVQLERELGCIRIFHAGDDPDGGERITCVKTVKMDKKKVRVLCDEARLVLRKVISDIKWHLDHTADFLRQMGW